MLIKIGSALIDPEEIAAVSPYSDETLSALEKATHVCIVFKHGESLWIDATMDEAEAALIDAGVVTDLTAGKDEDDLAGLMLPDEEIQKLKELYSADYRYLARDKDGSLYAFRHRPEYGGFYWDDPERDLAFRIDGLSFVSAEDEEPTEISSLLAI
jgi:hypothetical protein